MNVMAMKQGQKPKTTSWKTALLLAQLIGSGVAAEKLDAEATGVGNLNNYEMCECGAHPYTHLNGVGKCRSKKRSGPNNIGVWAKRVGVLEGQVSELTARLVTLETALGVARPGGHSA